jgi:hypothetical protein
MIKPQDKRTDETVSVAIPAACMDRIKEHAKELDDSSPEYVIAAIVQDYFDTGHDRGTGGGAKPKPERSPRPKQTAKTVAMPKKGKDAAAA